MRRFALIWMLILVLTAGCEKDEVSCISVLNSTEVALYVQPYSSDYTDADWIQPGSIDEFYSINCDCLDGFEYFSFYYDSLIIQIKDHEDDVIKFYKDGTTKNYDPTLSPFTNPDVWKIREIERFMPGSFIKSNYEERVVIEHYFCIYGACIKSLQVPVVKELIPSF
jgi:hypothetical protein